MKPVTHQPVVMALLALVALSFGCTSEHDQAPAESEPRSLTGIELLFEEHERGIDPYPTRILVTKGHLRIDDGVDQGDFILYDRRSREIFSVSHGERSLLKIAYRAVDIEPPYALALDQRSEVDPEAPKIAGQAPVHYTFTTNGETCHDVIAVAGLLSDARAAMAEYLETLAGEQALNLDKTPVEMQTACMLSELVFEPTRHLAHGFPVQEWDYRGYGRALLGFKEGVDLAPALFDVPEGYRVYSVNPQES